MGLFGGSKRTSVTETNSTVTNVSQGFEDIEGTAIAGSGNTITLSDGGALAAAESIARTSLLGAVDAQETSARLIADLGSASLEVADRAGSRSADLSSRALDFSDRASSRALDFAGDSVSQALGAVDTAAGRLAAGFTDALQYSDAAARRESATLDAALGLTERTGVETRSFTERLFDTSLDAVSSVLREGQNQLGNTVTNLNAIARQQSTSTDERVQDIARVGLIVAAVTVGVLGLAFIARGAR